MEPKLEELLEADSPDAVLNDERTEECEREIM
jgi:hypothetical protein